MLFGLACVLSVTAIALAVKLVMPDEKREYFKHIHGSREDHVVWQLEFDRS